MSGDESQNLDRQPLHLWIGILGVTKLVEGDLRTKLRDSFDTTLPRFDVMAELERDYPSGLRMGEISQKLLVTNGNITGIIDQLVKEGYVERTDDPKDGRASVVRLTDTGMSKFKLMADEHKEWIRQLMSGLSKDEIKQMNALLAKLRKSLHERLDKPNE